MKVSSPAFRRHCLTSLMAVSLVACGGGGGSSSSSDSDSSPTPTPNPNPPGPVTPTPEPTVQLKMVEGQVTDASGAPLDNTDVSIRLKASDASELMALNTQTDANGNYRIQIPAVLSKAPAAVESRFLKEGFSEGDYYTALNGNVVTRVDATLAQSYAVSIKREDLDNLAFSADGEPTLRISLLRNRDGMKRIVVGEALAADGEETEISLDLPTSNINDDTTVINAEIATFDSGDPDQLASYPGEFSAQGDVASGEGQDGVDYTRDDSSSTSNDLVSTTFFDLNLTDQDGNPLQANDDQASASSSSRPSIMRYASPSVYKRIYSDVDPSKDGVQFPFFVKRSSYSKWQYVGNGTLVDRSGTPVGPDHPTYPVSIGTDGSVDFPDRANNYSLYFKIDITRWNSWIRYINVDYYTLNMGGSQQPVNMCFNGTVEYGGGDPYEGTLYLRSPDYGFYRFQVNNGEFRFDRTISPRYADPLEKNSWSNWSGMAYGKNYRNRREYRWYSWWSRSFYSYWYTPWEYHPLNTSFTTTSDTLLSADQGCNEIEITMVNPAHCVISGRVVADDGTTPLAGEIVSISAGSSSESVLTNSSGHYRKAAWCDSDYTVNAVAKGASFTVTRQNSPYTQNFTDDNRDPIAALFVESKPVLYKGDETSVEWFASDPEGDDLTIDIAKCESDTNTCGIRQQDNRATLSFAEAGLYDFELSVSDGRNTVLKHTRFDVKIPDINRAPTIRGFNVGGRFVEPGGTTSVVQNADVVIDVLAVDANGDQVDYQWKNLAACNSASCLLSFSQVGANVLDITATDQRTGTDSLSAEAQLVISSIEDLPPVVAIQLSDEHIKSQNNVNIVPVVASLSAVDDLTADADLGIEWSLSKGNTDISDQISNYFFSDFNLSIPPGALGQGDYQLSVSVVEQDANGNSGQTVSDSVSFQILGDLPPSVELQSAINSLYGTASGGTGQDVVMTATASDNEGSTSIRWEVPAPLQFSRSGNSIRIQASSLLPGSHIVRAIATDSANQAATAERTIEVLTDEPPVINSLTVLPESQIADTNAFSSLAVTATVDADDDLGPVTISNWSVSPTASFTRNGNSMVMAAGSLAAGSYTVTVTVADQRNQTRNESVSFDVIERDGNIEIIIE